jgi:hypothetical protein
VVFGRFEAADPNELWVGDALHGPRVGDRKTYLFAFLDDQSRLAVGYRFGYAEGTARLAAAMKPAPVVRGVSAGVYVDNGSAVGTHRRWRRSRRRAAGAQPALHRVGGDRTHRATSSGGRGVL